jgi:hypothetical protein
MLGRFAGFGRRGCQKTLEEVVLKAIRVVKIFGF